MGKLEALNRKISEVVFPEKAKRKPKQPKSMQKMEEDYKALIVPTLTEMGKILCLIPVLLKATLYGINAGVQKFAEVLHESVEKR